MIISWLRAIFMSREDRERIVFLTSRMSQTEYEQEKLMSRLDDLQAIVVEVGGVVDALAAHVAAMAAELATAGAEDPRVGEAVDQLNSIKGRISALLPAAPVVEDVPAG